MFQPDHTPSQRGGPAEENFQFSGEPIGTHRRYLALALDQTDEIVFTDFIDDLIGKRPASAVNGWAGDQSALLRSLVF